MSDRPINMRDWEMRALIEGRKTQTRRVLKPQPIGVESAKWCPPGWIVDHPDDAFVFTPPRYAPGDRLWVREAWATGMSGNGPQIAYRATPDFAEIDAWDGPDEGAGPSFNYDRCPGAKWHDWLPDVLDNDGPWRPSIHMPRWASRLTLIVEGVRVQRLQEISEEDANAEGVFVPEAQFAQQGAGAPILAFAALWNSLHGADAVTPHVLRHTFVTWAMQRGEPIWIVAGKAGMDPAMIERTYGHHSPEYLTAKAGVGR